MKRRIHIIITGKVQSVSFRSEARLQARSAYLKGWVKNNQSGTVEITAEGEEDDLKEFLRWCARGPFPYGGDVNTVNQAAYRLDAAREDAAPVLLMAGYRQVIDLGDFDRSTFVLPTGNSGIPGHPRYDDCIDDFLAGRQRPLLFSRDAVEAAAEAHLALVPSGDGAPAGAAP